MTINQTETLGFRDYQTADKVHHYVSQTETFGFSPEGGRKYRGAIKNLAETIGFSDYQTSSKTIKLVDGIGFSAVDVHSRQVTRRFENPLGLFDSVWVSYKVNLEDSIGFSDSTLVSTGHSIRQVESLGLSDLLSVNKDITLNQDEVIGFNDLTSTPIKLYSVETLGFTDQTTLNTNNTISLIETLGFSDSQTIGKTLRDAEELGLSDEVTTNIVAIQRQVESLCLCDAVVVLESEHLSYVVNTKTGGISVYTDINFNSMSYPFGCKADGIYRMDGEKDDSVVSSIKTGLMDFGSSVRKQVPNIYLGITNNDSLTVKTTTNFSGDKKTHHYPVNSYNNATNNTRADLGKGVKSRYWQFEIEGIKGSLESFEVLLAPLKRRK